LACADNSATTAATHGTAVANFVKVRPFFIAWLLLALMLYAIGLAQQIGYPQKDSSRAIAAPTRLSGVDAPEVNPIVRGPAGGSHPVAVSSVFEPTGR
jgi:hypothetical protein